MIKKIYISVVLAAVAVGSAIAGNPDRIGQAGAQQLLINPWAQTSGMGWASMSSVRGLQGTFLNIGGLAYTKGTEIGFSNTNWLMGSGVKINAFGFAQKLQSEDVIAFSVMTTDLGDIEVTTVNQPNGGLGYINPRHTNIGIAYSKLFTTTISGGVMVKVHSESIPNASLTGVAIDAGIQYTASSNPNDKNKKNDIKFGISMKNVGPDARYSGDGVTFKATNPNNGVQQSFLLRTAGLGLPTLINIGASYDVRLDNTNETYFHKLTPALTFTSNAYTRNQLTAGMEYTYKELISLRAGYAYEKGIFKASERTTALTGLVGGFSVDLPMSSNNDNTFSVDYSFRQSNPFGGCHAIGVRVGIN
ncbi:MAG: PorV/PorQ family protein [Flavobacteriales bacterium]|nr:PorV/PorQ family protein [Flavobacteriales bacterium]